MKQILRKTISNLLNSKIVKKFFYGFLIEPAQYRGVMTQSEIDTYNNRKARV
jgi:hypothetical protein